MADDQMAEALLAMFKNYFREENDGAVAYTINGKALSKSDLIEEVLSAVEDVEIGNYYTTEKLKEKFKKP
ncbi:MAG: hypothetical protein R2825_04810 [Saprospiraceae bacterium]